jgi:predicted metal-dependent phosphoesterase TrpH
MMKIDLHTHSEASYDGGITAKQYAYLVNRRVLDIIAITDHDRIDFAQAMQKKHGSQHIIVGEEITTIEGELIGLYLTKHIEPGMTARETADAVHEQNGIVCVPHPFEKIRRGIQLDTLNLIANHIDIVETFNGRTLSPKLGVEAYAWAKKHAIPVVASSDAHGIRGAGYTYTIIESWAGKTTLTAELAKATFSKSKPPLVAFLYPKINTVKNKLRRHS